MSQSQAKPAPSRLRTFLHISLLVILTSMLCNTRPSKNPSFQLQQCGKNLHQIGVELESQRLSLSLETYPETLPERWGDTELPACPVGGQDSYRSGYQRAEDGRSYLLVCAGSNHENAEVPPDYPRIGFSSDESQRDVQATAVEEPEAAVTEDEDEERSAEDIDQTDEALSPAAPSGTEEVSEEGEEGPSVEPTPASTDS